MRTFVSMANIGASDGLWVKLYLDFNATLEASVIELYLYYVVRLYYSRSWVCRFGISQ
jgi:hypothetical protein